MRVKLIALSILLASCSAAPSITPYKMDIQQGNLITPEMREKVKLGMSRSLVSSILGTPLIADPFHAKRWDYVYRFEQGGKLVRQQRLTLYFEEDRLASIDDGDMPSQQQEKK